jgi:hypothetical protein
MRSRWLTACLVALLGASARAGDEPTAPAPTPDPLAHPFFQPGAEPGAPRAGPASKLPLLLRSCEEFFAPCADQPACPLEGATWLTTELLIGKARAPSLVPVVTTGPAAAGVLAGGIGQPGTVNLFGGGRVLRDWRAGVRAEAGMWFDPGRSLGIGARVYSLFSTREELIGRPDALTVVNVPNFVAGTPVGTIQFPAFVGFPGFTTGTVAATVESTFTGGDLVLRHLLTGTERGRLELLVGYRHMYLRDQFRLSFDSTVLGINPALAPRLAGSDRLRTRNNFGGTQLGLHGEIGGPRFVIEGHLSTTLGLTVSDVDYSRQRSVGIGVAGSPAPIAVGLVALGVDALTAARIAVAANQVPFGAATVQNELTYFGLVGEGGLRAKWQVTDHVRLTGGYSFVYWNNVRRAPDMYTNAVALTPRAVEFTTHLVTVGLEVRY